MRWVQFKKHGRYWNLKLPRIKAQGEWSNAFVNDYEISRREGGGEDERHAYVYEPNFIAMQNKIIKQKLPVCKFITL